MGAQRRDAPKPGVSRRLVATSIAGSIVEWYDLGIYGQASALILNRLFFPNLSPALGVMASFATFALGFFARPVGGLIFAHFGDRLGRRSVLVMTLLVMGVSTTLIGLMPTYATIGIAAPILLIVFRLLQGAGAGAEYAGATSLVAENAPPARRGYYAALPVTGIYAGIGLAAGVSAAMAALPPAQLAAWGWRVPFLFSVVMIGIGTVLRMSVGESVVFEKVRAANDVVRLPLWDVLRTQPRRVLLTMAANGPLTFNIYVIQIFALSYVAGRGVAGSTPLIGLLLGCVLSLAAVPYAGALSDRYGRRRTYASLSLFNAVMTIPFFLLLNTGSPGLIWLALAVGFGIGCCTIQAVQASFFTELFDARSRFTGIVFGREVTVALLAAPAPLIATQLTSAAGGRVWPVAAMMIFLALLGAVAVLLAPETRGIDLEARAGRTTTGTGASALSRT